MTTVNIDKEYHLMAKSLVSPMHPSVKAVVEFAISEFKKNYANYWRPVEDHEVHP